MPITNDLSYFNELKKQGVKKKKVNKAKKLAAQKTELGQAWDAHLESLEKKVEEEEKVPDLFKSIEQQNKQNFIAEA